LRGFPRARRYEMSGQSPTTVSTAAGGNEKVRGRYNTAMNGRKEMKPIGSAQRRA
jgi:hypothetical protein